MYSTPPLHQASISRALPEWVTMLHPTHTQYIVEQLRADYLADDGAPFSWYSTASDDDRQRLRSLIEARNTHQRALQKSLRGFQGITEFCKPLLTRRLNIAVAVDKAHYVFQPFEPASSNWPGVPNPEIPLVPEREVDILATRPVGASQSRSLFEAALHNFEGLDEVGAYSTLINAPDDDSPLQGLSMASFVRHCRELDLGRQYQAHLQSYYDGPRKAEIERLTLDTLRHSLRVRAQVAALQGLLSQRGLRGLNQLAENAARPTYGQHDLHCWRLSLFDIPLHDLLLIGPDQPDQNNPCIVYMPNDSEHPVREFSSRQEAGRHLSHRLLQSTFRRLLINCAYQDRQAELNRLLEQALFEPRDGLVHPRREIDLRFTPSRVNGGLWSALYAANVSRMKADARAIAVPTADVDAKARQERLAHWAETGVSLLNVAAFFVPGLNTVMAGVFAYQIMDSVFTGFHAWEEGDTAQALGQLTALAINAAVTAGFAVGTRLVQASGFVDALQRVWHDGQALLWHPQMARYASSTVLPEGAVMDASGYYRVEGKIYWMHDGAMFEIFQDAEQQWRVRHPHDPNAYAPRLHHHGDGRWQLAFERPVEWEPAQLLRRLGQFSAGLDDAELAAALRTTGIDSTVLRRTQATGLQPPALLRETLLRLRLDNQVEHIVGSVRHGQRLAAYKNYALPELLNMPQWPLDHVLKVYDGPEPWGDSVRYGAPPMLGQVEIEITRSDLESGHLSQTVLAQMGEQQRQSLLGDTPSAQRASTLDQRLADRLDSKRQDIFDSLRHSQGKLRSPAEQTLARQFPGLPDSALEEILRHIGHGERQRLASGRMPLRIAEEARLLQAHARLDQALLGLYRPSLANADSHLLKQALLAEHPGATATELFGHATADRGHCAALLGQQPIRPSVRSPLRLANGRLGYPLSGRGASTSVATGRLRALYPTLNAEQLSALQAQLSQAGDLGSAIQRLEEEQRTLLSALNRWHQAVEQSPLRDQRRQCSERLMRAWRQEGEPDASVLVLDDLELTELPAISARFPQVRALTLERLTLTRLEGAFLACFPNLSQLEVIDNPRIDAESLFDALRSTPKLQALSLGENRLTTLPPTALRALGAMRDLRVLNLHGNLLELNDASLDCLAGLPLEALGLSDNHITLNPALAARFQDLVHLKVLRLSGNPLQLAPDLRYMARLRQLDLDRCDLSQWPNGLSTLMRQPQYQLRILDLSHNRIGTVPDLSDVLQTPFARDVAARVEGRSWLFNFNPLEGPTRTRLANGGVNVTERAPRQGDRGIWRDQASSHQQRLWSDLFEHGGNRHLLNALERLAQSAEARQDAQGVATRVWAMLEKAGQDTGLRERLEQVAQDYPPTCGDAGADAFSALEIEVLAHETAGRLGDRSQTLLHLYHRLFRRSKVNELADRISLRRTLRKQALQDDVFDEDLPPYDELDEPLAYPDLYLQTGLVDDIEVRLALRQSLAARLDFPEPSRGMLYRDTARITQGIIDKVAAEVERLDRDHQARERWLIEQPGWVMHIKTRYAEQFILLTDFWRSGHDYLFYCLDRSNEPVTRLDTSVTTALAKVMPASPLDEQHHLRRVQLNDGQFKQAMDALNAEQQQVEHGLLLSLTHQVATLGG